MLSDETQPLLIQSSGDEGEETSPSRRTRVIALVLVFLLSTGANWTEACLGPLKSTLLEDMQINNTQYGVISASTQLANTILPIFAGLWIDRVGASRMAVFATSTVCIGAILAALACTSASYTLLVIGRIIQGMGVIVVDTAATKLIVLWSREAGWLGLAISCNFAFDRAAGALSKATSVPISQVDGATLPARTFWVAAVISTISLLAALAYNRFEDVQLRKAPSSQANATSSLAMLRKTLTSLPAFFVFIVVTQFYQPIAVFNNLSADILRWRGTSPREAGYLASIGQVTPIFIAPLLGSFFDRHGHRLEFIPLTAVLLGTTFALLAWTDIRPLIIMMIFSLGNAFNTPPYLCSLAILLKEEATFGCSYGIWKACMQGNQIIMNVTMGRLQDRTPGQGYERVLMVLFISKAAELIWGLSYVALDQIWALVTLTSGEVRRKAIQARSNDPSSPPWRSSGLRPSGYSNWAAIMYLITIMVSSWSLFFGYYR
jgi:MFS family permease